MLQERLLALTDDAKTAMRRLKKHLGPKFDVRTLSNISALLKRDYERRKYARYGHSYFTTKNIDLPRLYKYHASVFVDIVAASRADALIGVGGSGVSQLIAQKIGGRERVDGNALTLWQEDLEADTLSAAKYISGKAPTGPCPGSG